MEMSRISALQILLMVGIIVRPSLSKSNLKFDKILKTLSGMTHSYQYAVVLTCVATDSPACFRCYVHEKAEYRFSRLSLSNYWYKFKSSTFGKIAYFNKLFSKWDSSACSQS